MSKQWKWTLVAAAACLLTFATPFAAAGDKAVASEAGAGGSAYNLLAVDVEHGGAATEVVLSTDGRIEYETFVLDEPDRLVVDLSNALNRVNGYSFAVDAHGVRQVRAGQHHLDPHPLTRIVFDLERPVAYRIEERAEGLVVRFGDDAVPTPVFEISAVAVETLDADEPAIVETPIVIGEAQPVAAEGAWDAMIEAADEPSRAIDPSVVETLISTPTALAAPAQQQAGGQTATPSSYESRRFVTDQTIYSGKRISLNLVDADIKQVFRLFHEISGLNFVLDPDVAGRVTIVLDQVPWDQALDLILKNNGLDKVLEGNVLRIATTTKLAREAASRKQLKEAEELEVEPVTLTRTLSYAKAADVQRVIREGGILSGRGKVIVDERTNTLILSDIPKKIAPLDSLITTLDAETPQVMIEARIVETSKSFTKDLGVNWGFMAKADASAGTATGLAFPHNVSAKYDLDLGLNDTSVIDFSFGNVVDSFTLDLALDALETEGQGRIISSPKVATQNNERAEIEQGVRIPIVNTTATEINVEFVSASLRLVVTPQITAEGTIILDVEVENNSPDFVNTAGDIPSIRTQRAQTKVLINDGGTTVIGGIFTVNEGQSQIGVPWFRKLPLFGWLFRSQNVTQENRELLIFLTPKIIKLS